MSGVWWTDDPVLVFGMHRSGTSVLAHMLADAGVFLGHDLEANHESVAFLNQNDLLLARAHAAWDRPLGIEDLIEQPLLAEACAGHLRAQMGTPAFRRAFLGARGMRPPGPGCAWGFKDPRTTVTWPLWLRVFPRARAVYVRRHGVDVAASLHRRESRLLAGQKASRFAANEKLGRFASVRCLSLERAFDLWRETHAIHLRHRARYPALPLFEVFYEDLVKHPSRTLDALLRFLRLPVEEERMRRAVDRVKPDRVFAFRDDPECVALASRADIAAELNAWQGRADPP